MKNMVIMTMLLFSTLAGYSMQRDSIKKDSTSKSSAHPFFRNWSVKQTFQTPDGQQSPATFALSIPASGKNNWLVDGGISVSLGKLDNAIWTSKLIGEIHRNTLIDSAQYNYQLGYSIEKFKDKGEGNYSVIWIGNIKYVRDVIDTGNSIVTTLNFSFYREKRHGFNLGRPGYLHDQVYTYQLNPSVEAQYQQYFGGDKHKGAIVRPVFNLSAAIAVNKKREYVEKTDTVNGVRVKRLVRKVIAPTKAWELAMSYVNRYAVLDNTGDKEGYTKLLRAGVNYYFVNTNKSTVSLGGNYNIGSDPINGLKEQHYWQFALQVQF